MLILSGVKPIPSTIPSIFCIISCDPIMLSRPFPDRKSETKGTIKNNPIASKNTERKYNIIEINNIDLFKPK